MPPTRSPPPYAPVVYSKGRGDTSPPTHPGSPRPPTASGAYSFRVLLRLAEAVGKSPAYTNQTITGRKSASPQWVNLVAETLKLWAKERLALHRAAAKDQGYEIDLGVYEPSKRR